ncbi:hypothetical protein LTR37_020710 [Vermiconidia calcicola]|uniref:Uncharacterized protein n=1 Tax=Vermiconidia calcicola TaxID=1690605 RepID=A0ACC3MAM8_9PEZI|nr:hypothetical protein LTR37_020710 [Vermiconidia calcicola]
MPSPTSAAATSARIDDIPNEEVAQELSARASKNPQLRALNKAVKDGTATPEQMTQFGVYIQDVKDMLHLQRGLAQPAAAAKQQPWASIPLSVRKLAKLDPPCTAPKRNAGSVALPCARSGSTAQPPRTPLSYFEAYSALSTLSAAALAPGPDKRPTNIIAQQLLVRSVTNVDHRKFLEAIIQTRSNEGENTPQETTHFSQIMRNIESTLSSERIRRGGKEGVPTTSATARTREALISANIDPSVKEVSNADLVHELITRASQNLDLYSIVKLVNSKQPSTRLLEAFEGHVREIKAILLVVKSLGRVPAIQQDHRETAPPAFSGRPPPTCSPPHAPPTYTAPQRPQAPHAPQMSQAQPKRVDSRTPKGAPHMHHPTPAHQNHPASSVGANFHSVPYPLSLLPYKSWDVLHHNTPQGAICASCCKPQPLLPQQRKFFLVAERLSWGTGPVSANDRNANEEALWGVNAELEIYEPAVEDERIVVGGRQSREDALFPFASEQEAKVIMRIVAKADVLTTRTWDMWRATINEKTEGEASEKGDKDSGTVDSGREALATLNNNSRWLPSTDHTTSVKGKERAIIETLDLTSTVPSPNVPTNTPIRMQTLQDFYSILDKLERTSPMGARFLEAYAERLRDEDLEDGGRLGSRPKWNQKNMAPLLPP